MIALAFSISPAAISAIGRFNVKACSSRILAWWAWRVTEKLTSLSEDTVAGVNPCSTASIRTSLAHLVRSFSGGSMHEILMTFIS